ncbi:MAG: hypothetical protein JWQ25_2399 [Daejeonella sp.]|nr:hypothetical protein [Daejeonella sp.]
MHSFGYLYLSWRKGAGSSRHIVGVIKINSSQQLKFSYIKHAVEEAKLEGFIPFTEFPDLDREYSENVLDVFAQRLVKSERADIGNFLNFWEISPKKAQDKLSLLAYTQAWLPTDTFEILAEYNPSKDLCFITDLAGLSKRVIPSDAVKVGDFLTYKLTPIEQDKYAVQVFKGDLLLGYIKKIHNRVFYKKGKEKLVIKVKAIEKNGVIKRLFLKVSSKNIN